MVMKLQLFKIMLHTDSPEYNDKPDTKQGVDYPGECFQILNAVLVFLLQGFIFIKLLQRLFLLLFIHIDQLVPSKKDTM